MTFLTKITSFIFLILVSQVYGQNLEQNPSLENSTLLLPRLSYGLDIPLADFSTRFGSHFNLGIQVGYLTKRNFYIQLGYNYLFGNNVQEDVLSNLRTVEGGIIGRDMQFADIVLRMRGSQLSAQAGHLFPLGKQDHRKGILVTAGVGVLQHRVRIQDENAAVNQIVEPYGKGYDRLTEGISLHQSIGYLYLSADRMANFYFGMTMMEGFTSSVREYNYNQQLKDSQNRNDLSIGFQIGWIIPIYLSSTTRYY